MAQTSACLSDAVMASYIDRRLSLAERSHATAHLATCNHCLTVLANTVKALRDIADTLGPGESE